MTAPTQATAVAGKGYVTFRLGEREFATTLDEVREIVRLVGLERLPGMAASMAGVVELRGTPLPVMDLRSDPTTDSNAGDVVVLADETGRTIGVAVDAVTAVRATDELISTDDGARTVGLPAYVVEVMRDAATSSPVLRVDLRAMLEVATQT
jgi:purine-binding chemotaxis protein CheW